MNQPQTPEEYRKLLQLLASLIEPYIERHDPDFGPNDAREAAQLIDWALRDNEVASRTPPARP